jgi:hypothetical protein
MEYLQFFALVIFIGIFHINMSNMKNEIRKIRRK